MSVAPDQTIILGMRQLQMFQKVEYGGGPIFKVVLECYLALTCTNLHYLALSCTILHILRYTCSQQISQVIALDIAVAAQKVKVQNRGPV